MAEFECRSCGCELEGEEITSETGLCKDCLKEAKMRRGRLTRQEQLQELADRGCDTWEEYRGER